MDLISDQPQYSSKKKEKLMSLSSSSPVRNNSPVTNQTPVQPAKQNDNLKKIRQGAVFVANGTIEVLKVIEQVQDPYGASKVATVVRVFLEIAIQVRENSKQLSYISERVEGVTDILQRINAAPEGKLHVTASLNLFTKVVSECTNVAKEYRAQNIVIRMGMYGANKAKFTDLNTKLSESIHGLTLALSTETVVMLEKQVKITDEEGLKKAQEEEKQEIIRNESKIFEQIKQYLEKHQNTENTNGSNSEKQENKLSDQDCQDVVELQLKSVMARLAEKLELQPSEKTKFLKTEYHPKPPVDSKLLISLYDIEIRQKIAQGSFGTIYQGFWCAIPVVVKKVSGQYPDKRDFEQFVREVNIMSQLRNPYITTFYGACLEPNLCIVMEYMEQGSLDKLLQQKTLSYEKQIGLALDIAKGLLYLHNREVLHRDLKTANILVNAQGQAKLSDFGLSKTADQDVKTAHAQSNAIQWMAPETLKEGTFSEKSDIYSYGMVLWSIATGKAPFANLSDMEISRKVFNGEQEKMGTDVPTDFKSIIEQCWSQSPTDRPGLLDIIESLKKINTKIEPSPDELFAQGLSFEQQKDFISAAKYYRLAADKGVNRAFANLGTFYLFGHGVTADKKVAYGLFLQAAQGGHGRSQYNVATMLEKGDGVTQNLQEALHWYREAKKQNVGDAAKKVEALQKLVIVK